MDCGNCSNCNHKHGIYVLFGWLKNGRMYRARRIIILCHLDFGGQKKMIIHLFQNPLMTFQFQLHSSKPNNALKFFWDLVLFQFYSMQFIEKVGDSNIDM